MTDTPEPTTALAEDQPKRRTKRRYAHELFPHADEGETRPLDEEVPYLYARALGLDIFGTSWMEVEPRSTAGNRIVEFLQAARIAFLADALLSDMVGEEAWQWADMRSNEEASEFLYERALEYGVDPEVIKPYPCGPEPDHHDHYDAPDSRGWRVVHRADGPESECLECTEPIPDEDTNTSQNGATE
ncbi:hypothetical protein AS850_02840 [Frondihabitans sp. 762G35]|uniref:hypothetical protein n=1 Tax=Frondihabitans sp. 762G35 TaxID=1446794 RepID=UPI000D212B2D|nr:hypothetical protein [Frondihabitans sp. 762G35]ARC56009.1 hypothetical protein AS850_02840 [Frondihabitans sp. 762G35]